MTLTGDWSLLKGANLSLLGKVSRRGQSAGFRLILSSHRAEIPTLHGVWDGGSWAEPR